jgi:hypothetical protein
MSNDRDYHYQRAETELVRAQQATDPAAVKAHYLLAGYYLDRAYGDGNSGLDSSGERWPAMDAERRNHIDRLIDRLRSAGVIVFGRPPT